MEIVERIVHGICLFYWIQNSLCHLLTDNPMINLLSNIIGTLLIALLAYGGSLWKRIMAALLEKIFSFKDRKNPADFIPRSHYLMIIFLSAGSIGLIYILDKAKIRESIYVTAGTTIIVLLNFLFLYLHNRILVSYGEKWEKRLLQQRLFMYENQMEILKNSREKVYSLRHDMFDLNILLSNLLENAVEAVSDCDTKYLKITEKYEGVLKIHDREGIFVVDAILYTGQN